MTQARDWVAEHVMGSTRGWCRGEMGGGSTGLGGYTSWFNCDWCGRHVEDWGHGRCSKYPFPSFTLSDLMQAIGEKLHHHVFVRFDPPRNSDNFTVLIDWGGGARRDTDDPLEILCEMVWELYDKPGKAGPEIVCCEDCGTVPGVKDKE